MSQQDKKKRPGYLKQYAQHAGIAVSSAAEALRRVGVDYSKPFDFEKADRLREAARHADRASFRDTVYRDGEDSRNDDEVAQHPVLAESQARLYMFKAKMMELEYHAQMRKLIPAEEVDREWVRLARLVCERMRNISSRIGDALAAETDKRKVRDLLDREIDQALEELATTQEAAA